MSKSLGNAIDPQEILRDFGAEAFRLWAATEGDLSKQDLPCSKDKIRAETKTINKILNVSRFIMQFPKPKSKPKKITKLDQLFIDYIENLTEEADKSYNLYDFCHPAQSLRHFIWEIFASHYLELVKNRAYNQENKFSKEESESAKYTLYHLLERFLALLYPITPQITTTIGNELKLDLINSEFPKAKPGKSKLDLINKIMEFNSLVWKAKKDKSVSLREHIDGIEIPEELMDLKQDLIACHNL